MRCAERRLAGLLAPQQHVRNIHNTSDKAAIAPDNILFEAGSLLMTYRLGSKMQILRRSDGI